MSDSIDGITPVSSSPQHPQPIPHPASKALAADTVTLSDTAQATLLQEHGESVSEIAFALDLSIAEVLKDLGLPAATSQTTAPTPAALKHS